MLKPTLPDHKAKPDRVMSALQNAARKGETALDKELAARNKKKQMGNRGVFLCTPTRTSCGG